MIQKQPKIVVTGDYYLDHNIYAITNVASNLIAGSSSRISISEGGAWIIQKLLKELKKQDEDYRFEVVGLEPCAEKSHYAVASHTLWEPQELIEPGKQHSNVWRMSRHFGFDQISLNDSVAYSFSDYPEDTDVLVIADDAARFRFQSAGYPRTVNRHLPRWILLKTAWPFFKGTLWHELANVSDIENRLVVLITISDLRREFVRISQGLSWERTAMDIVRELKTNSLLKGLKKAGHVFVSLYSEGCLWAQRLEKDKWKFSLIFDPHFMEKEWAIAHKIKGEATGYMSCLTTALAAELTSVDPDFVKAVKSGLYAMRKLKELGHGRINGERPGIPIAEIAESVREFDTANTIYATATVPQNEQLDDGQTPWRILESDVSIHDKPLFGIAKRIAIFGPKAIVQAPFAEFGFMTTVDRDEIEALRNLRQLITNYESQKRASKPLALAVFGPPGAGKSFGIKQIAGEVFGAEAAFLEFNLSQFSDTNDLIGAFHQVRDKVLEGRTPIVFWDEFDSRQYQWLQFFLAPIQDGKFIEGQITHSIGKCVFVFAGATSYTMKDFGPPLTDKEGQKQFIWAKGPDFVSRISGSLDVLGPNPRQRYEVIQNHRKDNHNHPIKWQWVDDPSDICYPVRRALLLRSLLGLKDERLEIDRGLLAAMLEIRHYKYGARSFERIVLHLAQDKSYPIRRSNLPSDEVLNMNVDDTDAFKKIIARSEDFQQFADKLAPAIHETYRQLTKEQKWENYKYNMHYDDLPMAIQAENVAAAHRIPWILELAGLSLVRKTTPDESSEPGMIKALEQLLDVLAEEEHDLWMAYKIANGWRYGPDRNDEKRIHNCLIPYRELDVKDQKKDKNSIMTLPRIVSQAGFKIVGNKLTQNEE